MIELAQHIEILLLENDCVILPAFGGFVAHYTSARRVEEEDLFLPPARVIGFNQQLTINDGLLVQSYMAVYDTGFADATKMVQRDVDKLHALLREEGRVDLPNVGELRCSIQGAYDFIPYDNKLTTPELYGLDSFRMQQLSVPQRTKKLIPLSPADTGKEEVRHLPISLARYLARLGSAVAVAAVILLCFLVPTPLENTEVMEGNYASLMPEAMFQRIKKQSLVATPINKREQARTITAKEVKVNNRPIVAEPQPATPLVSKSEVKEPAKEAVSVPTTVSTPKKSVQKTPESTVAKQPATLTVTKKYHIIVASVGTEKDAHAMAQQLTKQGYADAHALIGDGKMRVCIQSFAGEKEAYRALADLRQNESYKNAWILKK